MRLLDCARIGFVIFLPDMRRFESETRRALLESTQLQCEPAAFLIRAPRGKYFLISSAVG